MKYGLIGEKLGHSYSKIIHEKLGNTEYTLTEVPKDEIEDFFKNPLFCCKCHIFPRVNVIIYSQDKDKTQHGKSEEV